MTPTEHLERIKQKCLANLALAEKRTPGPWPQEYIRRVLRFADKNPSTTGIDDDDAYGDIRLAPTSAIDSAFIAACAGAAEAGWRSTIAACEFVLKMKSDMDQSWKDICGLMSVKDHQEESDHWPEPTSSIIAAWPEELL